jgi:hypothetical protein
VQDRYAGDIGDFVKLGLLRALSQNRRLGIAWYRFPDEAHNGDGRHIDYLEKPEEYQSFDPELFHHLRNVVRSERSIASLLPAIGSVQSTDESLDVSHIAVKLRRAWRQAWFARVLDAVSSCDLVFADPDNGIIDDQDQRRGRANFGKQIPLTEVRALATDRCAVIYHHNTRRPGGHAAEVDHWLSVIGIPGLAIRATRYSPRTFFVLNPDEEIRVRVADFCERWSGMRVWLHQ